MTAWTEQERDGIAELAAGFQRLIASAVGTRCADCGTTADLEAVPLHLMTGRELVAGHLVGACTYCAELRKLKPPA